MNTQLLCLFTYKNELDTSLEFIMKNYILINPNIFILVNKLNDSEFYITYNVERGSTPIDSNWKTILVHRKKQSNTIYTINTTNNTNCPPIALLIINVFLTILYNILLYFLF